MQFVGKTPFMDKPQPDQLPTAVMIQRNNSKEDFPTANFATIADSLSTEQRMMKETEEGLTALKSSRQEPSRLPEEECRRPKLHVKHKSLVPNLELGNRNRSLKAITAIYYHRKFKRASSRGARARRPLARPFAVCKKFPEIEFR